MYPLHPAASMTPGYLLRILLSDFFSRFAEIASDRVSMTKVNRETLADFRMPVPPLKEQSVITNYLEQVTGIIDQQIDICARFIDLLLESRASLLTAAVTGRIDVRNMAASQRFQERLEPAQ